MDSAWADGSVDGNAYHSSMTWACVSSTIAKAVYDGL